MSMQQAAMMAPLLGVPSVPSVPGTGGGGGGGEGSDEEGKVEDEETHTTKGLTAMAGGGFLVACYLMFTVTFFFLVCCIHLSNIIGSNYY